MKKVIYTFLFICFLGFNYGQGYSTILDTFYVQTPEYSNTLGIDSLHFPCAISKPVVGTAFPIVILVHGTAALDKDANSTKDFLDNIGANYRKAQTRMFYDIADSLSSNGIMVLRYDKRSYTVNCIEKPACWFADTISPYDYIGDIHQAINFAKTIPGVDSCNIFLAGHSQGGSFVSQVAYNRSDIQGVLNMAGTAQPIDSVVIYQTEFINADQTGAAILREQFDSLRNGQWPMTDTLYMNHFSPRFWLDWISHTDSAVIVQKNSDKPTALMYGTADRFVPANIHYTIWQDSVSRPDLTFQLFPDIDHAFGTEYDSVVSPVVLNFMVDWIKANMQQCAITAIRDVQGEASYSVFPNPSERKINLESFIEQEASFELFNLNGSSICHGILKGNEVRQIDLSLVESGLYFLKVNSTVFKIFKP